MNCSETIASVWENGLKGSISSFCNRAHVSEPIKEKGNEVNVRWVRKLSQKSIDPWKSQGNSVYKTKLDNRLICCAHCDLQD